MGLYVAGHRAKRRHAGKVLLEVVLVLAAIAAAILAGKHFLSADTSITDAPPATTSHVSAPTRSTKHIDESFFSLDLPDDWEPTKPPNEPYKIYAWQNTSQNKGVRTLHLYVDGAPRLAVNRVLPIQADGARLVMLGDVSDNCVNFTDGAKSTGSSSLTGKWRGVNFLCDTANDQRDVVGASSPGKVDGVTLSSASGRHSFFFVYTDNSATPDYSIFTDAVNSFRLK